MKTQVENMRISNGNAVANQFIITSGDKIVFQSYGSVICVKEGRNVILDSTYWDYSKTTGKYRNQFLGETKADTKKKIDSGVYTISNLNE